MLTADRSALSGNARRNINELAARILSNHRAFALDTSLSELLPGLREQTADAVAVSRTVGRIRHLLDQDFAGKKALKTVGLQSLTDNAAHTVVLIAASAANWDAAQCVDIFADNIWGAGVSPIPAPHRVRERLATLPKGATRATASLLVDSTRDRVHSAEAERDRALAQIEAAQGDRERWAAQLATAQARNDELEAELKRIRTVADKEADARRSERMSATSDFETLRIDTARTLEQQIESLEDALDALGHGQSQVTDEYVRRSVTHLRRSLTTLRSAAQQDSQGRP
ncbi:hypothetical protein [Nocardia rhamnosiphila]|uniref:Chemotaxis protein n=1 Tax=Nocardia rhamnosiphila TaxID=426716 RepID=A0ABV2WIX0_9NOCA